MPHRVLRAVLLDTISSCCGPAEAEKVVDKLLNLGVRLPTVTITDPSELDEIPDGAAVVVGNMQDPAAMPQVGIKVQHAILFAGEDEAYPFHDAGLAPPLPCTVVWMPGEEIDRLRAMAERTGGFDRAALRAALGEPG